MARVEPSALTESELIYMAASLNEARQAEALLIDRGVDYAVQVKPFGFTLLGSQRNGAAFYVAVTQAQYCRSHLETAGLGLGVVNEEDSV
jgi:hypothetical protein